MLTRLVSSAKTQLKAPSSKPSWNANPSRVAGKSQKPSRTLATSFASSRVSSAASFSKIASTRFYAKRVEIVESQLADALKQNAINATNQFDAATLEDLLQRNGWEMYIIGNLVELRRSFADSDVAIEILTEAPEGSNLPLAEEHEEHEHHDHDHEHHDHDHAQTDEMLKGQNDFFNVVVSKANKGEKLVFGCHTKEGVLEIDTVTFTKTGVPYKHDPENPLTPGSLSSHTLSYSELTPELQDSFEAYLQEHGVNHDLAAIIYYSLYKYDLHYEQAWSYAGQSFLQ